MAIEDSGFGISSILLKDNSIRTISSTSSLGILSSIHPVFASDGKANKIIEVSSFNQVLNEFGSDFANINAYGQQNLNVNQVFDAGGACYVCRLLPDNAKTAHIAFRVGVKAAANIPLYKRNGYGEYALDENGNKIPLTVTRQTTQIQINPETQVEEEVVVEETVNATTSGIELKVEFVHATPEEMENFASVSGIKQKFAKVAEDDEGFTMVPLFFANYYSVGASGKNYGIRIINDFLRDAKVSDGRRYQMYLGKKTTNGVEILSDGNGFSFSFNPDATVSKTIQASESLQKIYQNYDGNREKQIAIEPYVENYEVLKNLINDLLRDDPVVTEGLDPDYEMSRAKNIEDFDFINGCDKEGALFDNVIISSNTENAGNYHFFGGGSDGDLEGKTGDELTAARNVLLKKFFNADIDTGTFMDVLHCDGGIIFDANYDMEIKKAMANVITWRRDICVIFDCGFTENLEQAIAVAKEIRGFAESLDGGENFAICPHCGITSDRITNVRVTGTYEMAYGLTKLYSSNPFSIYASQQNGDPGCVRKMIFDWVVTESKPRGYQEKLAKSNKLYWAVDLGKSLSSPAQGNYTGRNVYFYSNSSLYTEQISKLSEFRNGMIVNDLRRIVKLVLVKYTFDTNGAETAIANATAELSNVLNSRYPNNIIINYNLYQTDRDKLLNCATCELSVLFPDIFETWNVVIVADRQNG